MTTRQEKVNSLLQQLVAEYIVRHKPEELTGLLTIKNADVTADLEHAKIYFSILGQNENETLAILRRHQGQVQRMLGQKLQMKIVPRIAFVPDTSGQYADHISKLIKKIHDNGQRA